MLDTGIRGQVLTTKYSIVYMEKEAWPEKKDFLQEQERAMNGPYSHSWSMFVCLSSLSTLWPGEQYYLLCLYIFCGTWDKLPEISQAPMNALINKWMNAWTYKCCVMIVHLYIYPNYLTVISSRTRTLPYLTMKPRAQHWAWPPVGASNMLTGLPAAKECPRSWETVSHLASWTLLSSPLHL